MFGTEQMLPTQTPTVVSVWNQIAHAMISGLRTPGPG
jgi:hypothetical protein